MTNFCREKARRKEAMEVIGTSWRRSGMKWRSELMTNSNVQL